MINHPKHPPTSIIEAWNQIMSLNSGSTWIRIPSCYGFPSNMGICGGVLCTQVASKGMNEFINRLNAISDKNQ